MEKQELQIWFDTTHKILETAYLQHCEPWKQSGFSGPEERWIKCRKPIADCIQESGSFLDIGCANGYLLECIIKWMNERNLSIIPFGLDISTRLVDLAKDRLPKYKNNIFVGNAWNWKNPLKFDYVRTELVYVPEHLQKRFVKKIISSYLTDNGKLLITEYLNNKGQYNIPEIGNMLMDWGYDISNQVSGYCNNKEMTKVFVICKK